MKGSADIIRKARELGLGIPAFNVAHLPMTEPIIRAVRDQDSFALVEVSRIDWLKFGAQSPAAVIAEYRKFEDPEHVRLHLDHVPVVDEDKKNVDWRAVIQEALSLGYQSVMIDASRLSLEENIRVTHEVAAMAHKAGVPVESELGAVLGHEAGPLPPYEELFKSGKGFTRPEEAARFVKESGCDWLSVAIGNIHGAVGEATKDQKKLEARLALDHLSRLAEVTGIPLVLHGGSGIRQADMLASMKRGIAKVNVGTEIRQAYEQVTRAGGSVKEAQDATYARTASLIKDWFQLTGIRSKLMA
ncbi:MAG TPA: class II fructose-bisphosphate aldolase [Spirochaetia bacterium]|nr:class II fructose-bisphosphate aldolase [Spirochaetia bacterium]HTZ50455.1 class II fructose-bisphosphate aldolase [Spirochaetia bacterium]